MSFTFNRECLELDKARGIWKFLHAAVDVKAHEEIKAEDEAARVRASREPQGVSMSTKSPTTKSGRKPKPKTSAVNAGMIGKKQKPRSHKDEYAGIRQYSRVRK